MKTLNKLSTLTLMLLLACSCQATKPIFSVPLDSISKDFTYNGSQYYAGVTIDKEGINHPTIVEINNNKPTHTSSFTRVITDLFVYEQTLHALDITGTTFKKTNNNWVKTKLELGRNPHIIYSDQNKHLIVCQKSSLFKEGDRTGGCQSYSPDWNIHFSWRRITPQICNNQLVAVQEQAEQETILYIDLKDGKILKKSAAHPKTVKAICLPK